MRAEQLAPDYPLVQSARFFYEIEMGRLQEAKKYARFIDDKHYVKAVYGVAWTTGLPLK